MSEENEYQRSVLLNAIHGGGIVTPEAVMAAQALFWRTQNAHPSYSNTRFAIASWMPEYTGHSYLRRWAYHIVINGVVGYFQWETHNGGTYSVRDALIHLDILDSLESPTPHERSIKHKENDYLIMKPEFLMRIVKHFGLHIGIRDDLGEFVFLPEPHPLFGWDEWDYLKEIHYPGGLNPEAYERFRRLIERSNIPS